MRESYHAADQRALARGRVPAPARVRLLRAAVCSLRPRCGWCGRAGRCMSIWAANHAEAAPRRSRGPRMCWSCGPRSTRRPHASAAGWRLRSLPALLTGADPGRSARRRLADGLTCPPSWPLLIAGRPLPECLHDRPARALHRVALGLRRQRTGCCRPLARLVFAGRAAGLFLGLGADQARRGSSRPRSGPMPRSFPARSRLSGYDPSQMGLWHTLVVLAGGLGRIRPAGADRAGPFDPAGGAGDGRASWWCKA